MNDATRKEVSSIVSELEALKAKVEDFGNQLRALADAEQEKFDAMPEGLQQGDRGQAIESAASTLDEAASAAEEGNLTEALDALGNLEN